MLETILGSIAGAAVSGLMNKKDKKEGLNQPTVQTQQTSSLTPYPGIKPAYDWMQNMGMGLLNTPTPFYPFQTFVSPSDPTQLAHKMGMTGVGMMDPYLNQGFQNYGFLSNAADVANNPYVQNMMQANRGLTLDTLFRDVLPQITASHNAVAAPARNNARLGMLQGQAIGDSMTGLGRTNAQMMGAAYNSGLGAQTAAMQALPSMLQAQMSPYAGMLSVGKDVEGYQQGALQDQMQRFMWPYTEPYSRMQLGQNLASTFQPLGTQTGQAIAPNPNYLSTSQALLGGAMMGSKMLSPLFSGLFNSSSGSQNAIPLGTSLPGYAQQSMLSSAGLSPEQYLGGGSSGGGLLSSIGNFFSSGGGGSTGGYNWYGDSYGGF